MDKLRYLLFFIILSFSGFNTPVFGQNLKKFYTYEVQTGGDLIFIYPFDGFNNTVDKSTFIFDITWKAGADSAVINFSYFTDEPLAASVLEISSDALKKTMPAKRIFIDFEKRKWHNRYRVVIPFGELVAFAKLAEPPRFVVWAQTKTLNYTVKQGKWEKYAGNLDKVLYIKSIQD